MVKKAEIPGHIVDSALDLAITRGWAEIGLADIAAAAKLRLADIHAHYRSKQDILAAFARRIDAAVVAGDDGDLAAQPAPDRLFDVLMRRFDKLNPHKEALRAIARDSRRDPLALLCGGVSLMRSMAWMLETARLRSDGMVGRMRTRGLAAIYMSTARAWFADDSADMAGTMAHLDRRLRQADRFMTGFCRTAPKMSDPYPEPTPEG